MKTTFARTPNVSKITYRRSSGAAKFTLSALVTTGGRPASGVTVYLQTSSNGTTWKSTYPVMTSSSGKASKSLKIKTAQVRYYRWYTPTRAPLTVKAYSRSTKVTVK